MIFYGTIGLMCLIGFLMAFFILKSKVKAVCCIGWCVIAGLSVVLLLVGPKTSVKPIYFDASNTIDLLNEVIVYIVVIEFFVTQLAVLFIFNRQKSTSHSGKSVVVGIILAIVIIAFGIGWGVYTVKLIT